VPIHDWEEQGKRLFLWAELRRAQAGSLASVRFHGVTMNVNRRALAGAVLFVAAAAVALRAQAPAQQITAGLQITSPAGTTTLHPGDTITVTVAPLAGVNPSFVGLLGQFPIEVSACASQPCYRFTLTVPATIRRAGLYSINAIGAAGAPGTAKVFASGAKYLDVEPSAAVTNLNVDLTGITFQRAGESMPLIVRAGFANGTGMDITRSTGITYTSSDTNVATVSREGVVTAVGTGCGPGGACVGVGMIYVKYGGKMVMVQVSTSALKHSARPKTTGGT
jgi:hypothetical protein